MSNKELKIFLYTSIISADNDELSEEVKQEILSRSEDLNFENANWKYILEPIEDEVYRKKMIDLLEYEAN